jgi:hypothetical protein
MTAVLMLILRLFALQTPAVPSSINGVVIKAGTVLQQTLQNARLELTEGPDTPLVVRTDSAGRFAFSNLAPGRYRLSVTRDGFIRQQHPKPIVIQPGQQIRDIVFQLDPAATVSGWIQDDAGEPIANVLVEALRRTFDVRGNRALTRAASAITNDRGEYRIFWLDPGDYFFYASSPVPETAEPLPSQAVVPTYFPSVTEPTDAKSIRVDVGREVTGVDFRLRRTALVSVRGNVADGMTGRPAAATITLTPPADDPSFSRFQARSVANGPQAGEFALSERLPPGSYIVTAKGTAPGMSAFQRITIRSVLVSYPYDIHLTLSPPLSLSGRMLVDPITPVDLRGTKISLASVDPALPSPTSERTQADGQFVFKSMAPGTYVVDVSDLPEDLYLKNARVVTTDVLEQPLTIQKQNPQPLQIVLGSDGGKLSVTVFDTTQQPRTGALVVLIPDAARRHRRDQYRAVTSGEGGQAVIRGIPPGNYRVFAWKTMEPNAYLNSDYARDYEDLGIPVRIGSGNNATISVRMIPKDF